MNIAEVKVSPILVNREAVQEMLGGISRSTFYNKRKEWKQKNTPFPEEVPGMPPVKGGSIYRYDEVIKFCRQMGFIASEQH